MHYLKSITFLMAGACGIAQAWVEYNEITLDCANKHAPLNYPFCGDRAEVEYYNVRRARPIQNNGNFGANCHDLGMYASKLCCDPLKVPEATTQIDISLLEDGTCEHVDATKT
ncbi:hypothetical protein MJO28_012143 [Puccinia striiformis f. sp. tritici]|uniref:Uncharacterized protein n=3 Tax=Puccinia striiformis TaxID=27350 RepID=A0A2S4W0B3_9BASI|nr:hypothetical protein Pst134EB_023834 [Puccinia striiformis f. sp. tritici]KAI9611226.1 hypothetical protein KEM48_004609 [Puccinia striiformis f. sp. tritici PST-130]POW15214.1 hypothetical protein PSHT_07146 [Puccinia striiformis]KAI7942116.1 hypothetical protein MJO28_012143 [Puccinia striiformis f. sp. tritici]KAI7945905.1 hypothetical protein MJO29_012293 [Puccinia striiformis f. sp. tritici]